MLNIFHLNITIILNISIIIRGELEIDVVDYTHRKAFWKANAPNPFQMISWCTHEQFTLFYLTEPKGRFLFVEPVASEREKKIFLFFFLNFMGITRVYLYHHPLSNCEFVKQQNNDIRAMFSVDMSKNCIMMSSSALFELLLFCFVICMQFFLSIFFFNERNGNDIMGQWELDSSLTKISICRRFSCDWKSFRWSILCNGFLIPKLNSTKHCSASGTIVKSRREQKKKLLTIDRRHWRGLNWRKQLEKNPFFSRMDFSKG